jgi:hypothetical protein
MVHEEERRKVGRGLAFQDEAMFTKLAWLLRQRFLPQVPSAFNFPSSDIFAIEQTTITPE